MSRPQRMTLRRGSDGRLMLIFAIDVEEEPQLQTDLPLSVNLILPDREPVNVIGDAHSMYAIGERRFRATAGAYMRTNIGALAGLAAAVMRLARLQGGETILDLYGGVGIFSAFMGGRRRSRHPGRELSARGRRCRSQPGSFRKCRCH